MFVPGWYWIIDHLERGKFLEEIKSLLEIVSINLNESPKKGTHYFHLFSRNTYS